MYSNTAPIAKSCRLERRMTVAKVALRPQALGQRSLLRPDLNGGNGSEGDIRDNGFYVKQRHTTNLGAGGSNPSGRAGAPPVSTP
jgi:hypothetical protein